MFKINPNYLIALGTKENFAAGVVKPEAGNHNNPVTIDGQQWYWPMVAHVDGPYQQETGNFADCRAFFPDFLPPDANHDTYTAITVDYSNPNWISSGISSALSITVTREYLNAIYDGYNQFMSSAQDPWAEFSIVTYAYNRGVNDFLSKKIFSDNRSRALASANLAEDMGMGGFANHVPTVKAITHAMNTARDDIYDAEITWQDMTLFFTQLREFYARGVPADAEWSAMIADVQRAFTILSHHWGKNSVSLRYDFLTLFRVARQYLPRPYNPRPTGPEWYYQITASMLPTAPRIQQTGTPLGGEPVFRITTLQKGGMRITVSQYRGNYPVKVRLFDAAGGLVDEIHPFENSRAPGLFLWSGMSQSGTGVAPGVYVIQAVYAGKNRAPVATMFYR
jgi:hypothetical protein